MFRAFFNIEQNHVTEETSPLRLDESIVCEKDSDGDKNTINTTRVAEGAIKIF